MYDVKFGTQDGILTPAVTIPIHGVCGLVEYGESKLRCRLHTPEPAQPRGKGKEKAPPAATTAAGGAKPRKKQKKRAADEGSDDSYDESDVEEVPEWIEGFEEATRMPMHANACTRRAEAACGVG